MSSHHPPDNLDDRILAVCRDLVAAGIYPGGKRLRDAVPGYAKNTLLKARRRLVEKGVLDLSPVGGEQPQVGGGVRGRPGELSNSRRAVLDAMEAMIARREYPDPGQVAVLLRFDVRTVRGHRRALIVAGRLVIPADLVRERKASLQDILPVAELEERMARIMTASLDEKRIGRNKARAVVRGATAGSVAVRQPARRDRGPLAAAIRDYDHAIRRIRALNGR